VPIAETVDVSRLLVLANSSQGNIVTFFHANVGRGECDSMEFTFKTASVSYGHNKASYGRASKIPRDGTPIADTPDDDAYFVKVGAEEVMRSRDLLACLAKSRALSWRYPKEKVAVFRASDGALLASSKMYSPDNRLPPEEE
jgi:hypothetical protein